MLSLAKYIYFLLYEKHKQKMTLMNCFEYLRMCLGGELVIGSTDVFYVEHQSYSHTTGIYTKDNDGLKCFEDFVRDRVNSFRYYRMYTQKEKDMADGIYDEYDHKRQKCKYKVVHDISNIS